MFPSDTETKATCRGRCKCSALLVRSVFSRLFLLLWGCGLWSLISCEVHFCQFGKDRMGLVREEGSISFCILNVELYFENSDLKTDYKSSQ